MSSCTSFFVILHFKGGANYKKVLMECIYTYRYRIGGCLEINEKVAFVSSTFLLCSFQFLMGFGRWLPSLS